MGDWTAYIHDRLSRLERALLGDEQATAIANAAPAYTADTEALTTQGPTGDAIPPPVAGQQPAAQ